MTTGTEHAAGPERLERPHPVHGTIRYSALDLVSVLNEGRPQADRIDPPTAEQIAIIEGPLEPTVVIAGAGSGKTTVIGQRVLFLVANGLVRADSVLGLTFTRKAVAELGAKIRANLREFRQKTGQCAHGEALLGLDLPVVQTYNSYAAGLVGEYGMAIGVEEDTTVLDDASAIGLVREIVDAADETQVPPGMSRGSIVAGVRALSGQLDEHLVAPARLVDYIYDCYTAFFAEYDLGDAVKRKRSIPPEAKADYAARYAELDAAAQATRYRGRDELDALVGLVCEFDAADVIGRLRDKARLAGLAERYRMAKREGAAMEFSDQVAFAHSIMDRDAAAWETERARWSVVLLDEYQDTSDTQVRLLTRLFAGRAVTAVGDPRQAIYGWRGAAAGNIAEFPLRFTIPPAADAPPGAAARPAHRRELSISWRNPKRVLRVANAISAGISRAEPGAELRAPDEPDAAGAPGPLPDWRDGTVTGALTTGAPVPDAGTDLMADLVAWLGQRTGSRAVLCRKSAQMFEAAAALRAAGHDVHLVGTAGALEDTFVMDVVAALTVITDPTAGGQAMRLLTGRACRLGPADVAALERLRRARCERLARAYPEAPDAADLGVVEVVDELSQKPGASSTLRADLDACGLSRVALGRIARLAGRLRLLRRLHAPVPTLIRETVRVLGVDAEITALGPERAAPHRIALDVLVSAATGLLARAPGSGLREFLDWLELSAQGSGLDEPEEAIDKDSGAIIVMTIHKSKGLEFDNVAVPHLTVGDLPGRPRSALGWLSTAELPYPLRGDAASFPRIDLADRPVRSVKDLKADFASALGEHHEAEERRLAYVAVTRAQRNLWLGAATFTSRKTPNELSPYYVEATRALGWAEPELPGADEGPPERAESYSWPAPADTAAMARRAAKRRVLDGVSAAPLAELADPTPAAGTDGAADADAAGPLVARLASLAVEFLDASAPGTGVRAPSRLSATSAVAIAEDPAAFLAERARPMPRGPVPAAALGTAFHTWVENYFGQAALQDLEDSEAGRRLPPALADRFAALKRTFLASEFAQRTPLAVELPFELRLGGPGAPLHVPGKIDAVFPLDDGGIEIVDWKTGHSTAGQTLRAKSVQLSVYALAVAQMPRFAGRRVTAAFFYLGDDAVVRPESLLTAEQLEAELRPVLEPESEVGAQPASGGGSADD